MGNVFYLLCPEKDRYITSEQKANNKEKLMEYCKSNLFSEYDDEGIERLLNRYAYSIENITEALDRIARFVKKRI